MDVNLDVTEAQKSRLNQLNELDEKCIVAVDQATLIQQQRSKWHDRFIKNKVFYEGYWELLYDSRFKRDFKGKPGTRWLGPYQIDKVFDNGTICLVTVNENRTPFFANGQRLRLYHKPISRDVFITQVASNPGYQLVQGKESFSAPVNLQKAIVIYTKRNCT